MRSSRAFGRVQAVAALAAATLVLSACGSDAPVAAPSTTSTGAVTTASAATGEATAPATGEATAPATESAATESAAGTEVAGEPGVIDVTVTEADGCVATPDTAPAGPVTFNITNVDAAGVFEVELVSDQRIRGERENLAPGFDATFSVKLDGGAYEIYCPGATTERRPFTVTGEAAQVSTDITEVLQQATVDYADYIDDQTGFLVEAVEPFVAAIKAGDLEKSKELYAKARPFFERIEPVAESFGDLDPRIDLRIGDVTDIAEWTGFHPIEKALFEEGTTDGLDKLADQLLADVKDLQARATVLGENTRADADDDADRYRPDEVANGAVGLLAEVQASKITGEEEAYSHIDLLDFESNVEGSVQAFATLRPALDQIDADLAADIAGKFDSMMALLQTHRDPSQIGGYTLYPDLTDGEVKALADELTALGEPLSLIAGKIATA